MRTIKVFLASSDELANERLQFDSLFNHLNRIFRPRGLYLELSKWEYLDSSMGPKHKQEEYNEELKTCEMCIVMFWTRFGEYTNEELMTAYNELKAGRNPKKLYVFFKEPADMSDDLKAFKESFSKDLGHFYCKFETVDSMRLHFLLQLEAYNTAELKELVKVENSKVAVDGQAMVDLNNVPFAAKNKEYRRLKDEIAKTESEISAFEGILAVGPNDVISNLLGQKRTDLYYLKEELSKHENLLFDTALRIAQRQGARISERMARAIEAFEDGRATEANAILGEAMHDAKTLGEDISRTKELLKHQQENAAISISELLLKASIVLVDESMAIEDRINEAEEHYEAAYSLANKCDYDKELYIELLWKYSDFLTTYAKHNKSLKFKEELLAITLATMGADNTDIATIFNNIGHSYDYLGEYRKALEHYEKALKIKLCVLGENHPYVAITYNNIGSSYHSIGKYELALEYIEKALKIQLDILGWNHPDVATSYNNLGSTYDSLGEHEIALEYHNRAMEIRLNVLGENNAEVATGYGNIGSTYESLGEYETALEYYKKALKVKLAIFGEVHPSVASSYGNIGHAYHSLRVHEKALEYLKKSLEIKLDILGENHPDLASTYSGIGYTYDCLGKHEKALEHLGKALEIILAVHGENHPDVAGIHNNMGSTYESLKRYGKALEHYNKALKISSGILGNRHPKIGICYNNIGYTYNSLGEYDKALGYYYKALDIAINVFGESHPNVASTYNNIGYTYHSLGQHEKALEHLEKALEICLDVLGMNHPDTQDTIRLIERAKLSQ